MSRIQRDTASYFPHDAHAASGGSDTIKILQGRYGNDGYATWFKILEKLTSTDGHYIDCRNPVKWQLFISYLGINEITTVEILKILVEIGNIDAKLWNNKIIWCQSLVDNISDVYKNRRREIPSKPVITDNKPITTDNNPINSDNTSNNQITTKQSKVDKSKVDKNREGIPEWCQVLLDFKNFNIRNGWCSDIEAEFGLTLNLIEASKDFIDYWSERKKEIKSMKTTYKNSLRNCVKWGKCLNPIKEKEKQYTGRG